MPTTCLDTSRPVSPNMFYTLSRPNRPHTISLSMTSPPPQYCSTSPKSLGTSVCAVEAAPLPFYMRLTGTDSFAPHGNVKLTSKLSEVASSHIGPLDQHSTSFTLVNINNCALAQPPARSPAQKENATSRAPTDSSRTILAIGASIWYHSFDGSWWLSKVKQPPNDRGRYVIRFLDNPSTALIALPGSAYNTALHAPYGSWCLQTHGRSNPLGPVLRS